MSECPHTCLFCEGPMEWDAEAKRHVCERMCVAFVRFSLLRDVHESRDAAP